MKIKELPPNVVRTHSRVNLVGIFTLTGAVREILEPTRIASIRAKSLGIPDSIIICQPRYTEKFGMRSN